MSSSVGTGIFNVQEAQGTDRVQFETTAAAAQAEAPTSTIAREVEKNAEKEQDAAHKAAQTAQNKLGHGDDPVVQLQQKTNEAVKEGQQDVEAAKAQSATYLDQAKNVASNVAASVQSYLPSQSTENTGASSTVSNVASQVQATATSALGTTKEYLSSAQQAAQPHIDRAVDAATKYMSGDKSDPETTPASSTGIPAAK